MVSIDKPITGYNLGQWFDDRKKTCVIIVEPQKKKLQARATQNLAPELKFDTVSTITMGEKKTITCLVSRSLASSPTQLSTQ